MTKDLEETLAQLGPDYAKMVRELRSKCICPVPYAIHRRRLSFILGASCASALAAACLVVMIAQPVANVVPRISLAQLSGPYSLAPSSAVQAIIASQNPDGSWKNDFLTCQNAAALRDAGFTGAPYKKALRYLRSKGLSPISTEELSSRSALLKI